MDTRVENPNPSPADQTTERIHDLSMEVKEIKSKNGVN